MNKINLRVSFELPRFWTLEFSAEQQRRCSEIIRGIFNRPLASGRTGGYLVRLRCSIKAAGECQVGAEKKSGDYKAMGARSWGNGLALCRWPSDIQACIFWISLEWLGQRQAKDRSNNYFLSSTCFFFLASWKQRVIFSALCLCGHVTSAFLKSQSGLCWFMAAMFIALLTCFSEIGSAFH